MGRGQKPQSRKVEARVASRSRIEKHLPSLDSSQKLRNPPKAYMRDLTNNTEAV